VPYSTARLAALERENQRIYEESLAQSKDPWDSNSYNGSSCYDDQSSVTLLDSDDEKNKKDNKKGEKTRVAKRPIKIEIQVDAPTQPETSSFPTQASDGDNVTINLLEQELEEREAKRKRDEDLIEVMMKATAGYPGSEEVVTQEINPPEPEMGTVCVWCGEEPCEWTVVSRRILDYYRYQVETVGPTDQLPPHNIMRKRMYRQVAMIQGFVRREEHPYCIHTGIRALSPSPDGNYMGHKYV
jgi:hypothetical protein